MNMWIGSQCAIATESNSASQATAPQEETNQKLQKRLAELKRDRQLIEADALYLGGQFAAAEKIYRQVKTPLAQTIEPKPLEPVLDPANLSPAGKVYWRETQAGEAQNLQTRTLVPLRLLVEQYPEFIPGHLRLAEILNKYNFPDDALIVLEKASAIYPA